MDNYIHVVASVIVVTYPLQAKCIKSQTVNKNIEIKAGNDQEKAQPERIPTPKTEVGKSLFDNQVLILL